MPAHSATSIAFAETRVLERIASIDSVGDAYDNALAENTIRLYKTEAVGRGSPSLTGPMRTIDDVEYATLEWVDWFNNRRQRGSGTIPVPTAHRPAHRRDDHRRYRRKATPPPPGDRPDRSALGSWCLDGPVLRRGRDADRHAHRAPRQARRGRSRPGYPGRHGGGSQGPGNIRRPRHLGRQPGSSLRAAGRSDQVQRRRARDSAVKPPYMYEITVPAPYHNAVQARTSVLFDFR